MHACVICVLCVDGRTNERTNGRTYGRRTNSRGTNTTCRCSVHNMSYLCKNNDDSFPLPADEVKEDSDSAGQDL